MQMRFPPGSRGTRPGLTPWPPCEGPPLSSLPSLVRSGVGAWGTPWGTPPQTPGRGCRKWVWGLGASKGHWGNHPKRSGVPPVGAGGREGVTLDGQVEKGSAATGDQAGPGDVMGGFVGG